MDTKCDIPYPTIIDINNADCRVGNFQHNNVTNEIPNFNETNCNETTNNVVNNDLLQHNNTCNIMEVENIISTINLNKTSNQIKYYQY